MFLCLFFFFFNDTATTEIYTLSLHDALPICDGTQASIEGDWSKCQLHWPTALFYYGDTVYVGSLHDDAGILMKMEGNVSKPLINT